jgi:hypothetical protein
MHVFCRTARAVLLLGISDEHGVKRFPCNPDDTLPGVAFSPRLQEAINGQLMDLARTFVAGELKNLDIIQNYADVLTDAGEELTVYLGTGEAPKESIAHHHLTLPDLIRRTPQGKSRVILIKSMQVFSGALTQETKAVDFAEAIKHFDET